MIQGSCLCGAVRWTYNGAFERMTHCHCGMCRKAHGAPFATYAVGPSAPFAYASGEDSKITFESSPAFMRSFCKHCGSVLPNTDLGDIVAIPAGGIEGDPGLAPSRHIFTKWKAPWHTISDALPQHDNYPGAAEPAVDRALPAASTDGVLRGSCLCGKVAYEVTGAFIGVHNCHCSRCRKARAAAHTTNGFTAFGDVRYTRGGDTLTTYHPDGARYFRQVFCPDCGSGLPRLDEERQVAVLPFGSLDDDPGRGADDHIFVGSKSSWYPVTDSLPQFEGAPQ
jgi:hypothetical protein